MTGGVRRTTFRLATALATLALGLPLTSCRDDDKQTSDKCSQLAKPAHAGQSVTWSGIKFRVPDGWYPVDVCFATGLAMPLGYLTTEAPHAQCHANTCGPPVDHLGENDVLVVAEQTSASLIARVHPNATVAGYPAQIQTRTTGALGANRTVQTDVLLPHHEVLELTSYLGPDASSQRIDAMIHGGQQAST
jgi:hypothetical protein